MDVETTASSEVVQQGDTLTVTAAVTFQAGERLPVEAIELRLRGAESRTFAFDLTGTRQSAAPWVQSVSRVRDTTSFSSVGARFGYDEQSGQNVTFGSGRGYGDNTGRSPATLGYEVVVDTSTLPHGEYRAEAVVVAGDGTSRYAYPSTDTRFVVVQQAPDDDEGSGGAVQSNAGGPGGEVADAGTVPSQDDPINRDPTTGFDLFAGVVLLVSLVTIAAGYLSLSEVYAWYRGH